MFIWGKIDIIFFNVTVKVVFHVMGIEIEVYSELDRVRVPNKEIFMN